MQIRYLWRMDAYQSVPIHLNIFSRIGQYEQDSLGLRFAITVSDLSAFATGCPSCSLYSCLDLSGCADLSDSTLQSAVTQSLTVRTEHCSDCMITV